MSSQRIQNIRIDATKIQHKLLRVYRELRKSNTVYTLVMGGGGSGKSYALGQYLIRELISNPKKKLLVIRQTASTHKESTFAQLEEGCKFWQLVEGVHYKKYVSNADLKITFPLVGSEIIFKGLDDPEKIKSIFGIHYLWVEEASEIPDKSTWQILNDRIRGNPRIFLSFNPIEETHWIKKYFYDCGVEEGETIDEEKQTYIDNFKRNITYLHSTYLDNPFVGDKYIADMEWYKVNDPEHYQVYGLGQWGSVSSERPFIIWNPNLSIRPTTYNPLYPVELSFDFNVKITCIVRQSIGGKKIYLEEFHDDINIVTDKLAMHYAKAPEIFITGDKSGNNTQQFTTHDRTFYDILRSQLTDKIFRLTKREPLLNFSFVPRGNNLTHKVSRIVCNALIHHYGENFIIDPRMKNTIRDMKVISATAQGELEKNELDRKNIGHHLDSLRYSLAQYDREIFLKLNKYEKLVK